jgi:transposase-like protein
VPRCPICDSPRVVIVLSATRRGLCAACGARWVQDGGTQRQVQRLAEGPVDQRTGAR